MQSYVPRYQRRQHPYYRQPETAAHFDPRLSDGPAMANISLLSAGQQNQHSCNNVQPMNPSNGHNYDNPTDFASDSGLSVQNFAATGDGDRGYGQRNSSAEYPMGGNVGGNICPLGGGGGNTNYVAFPQNMSTPNPMFLPRPQQFVPAAAGTYSRQMPGPMFEQALLDQQGWGGGVMLPNLSYGQPGVGGGGYLEPFSFHGPVGQVPAPEAIAAYRAAQQYRNWDNQHQHTNRMRRGGFGRGGRHT